MVVGGSGCSAGCSVCYVVHASRPSHCPHRPLVSRLHTYHRTTDLNYCSASSRTASPPLHPVHHHTHNFFSSLVTRSPAALLFPTCVVLFYRGVYPHLHSVNLCPSQSPSPSSSPKSPTSPTTTTTAKTSSDTWSALTEQTGGTLRQRHLEPNAFSATPTRKPAPRRLDSLKNLII